MLNATGVIVHTNLGRAPLAADARGGRARRPGYSNLEWDWSGARGSRHEHVAGLLRELTGAEAAMVVNNCAGAVLLAAAALAGRAARSSSRAGSSSRSAAASGSPRSIAQAGARLVEVGTTNRTRRADYERAIGPATGAILRAHPSNFRQLGFVAGGRDRGVVRARRAGDRRRRLGQPRRRRAGAGRRAAGPPLGRAGAALVCFSGDKLLGGPQAGLMVGAREAVAAARAHPLARALRLDKLALAALEATLALYRDPERARAEIPVLAMLTPTMRRWPSARGRSPRASARRRGRRGGGEGRRRRAAAARAARPGCRRSPARPTSSPPRLRAADPPVVGRIQDGRLLLDPRTLAEDEIAAVAGAVRAALRVDPH